MGRQAQRWPRPREIRCPLTEHDGMPIDSIFIDQPGAGETSRKMWSGNLELALMRGLQFADRALNIILDEHGVGADG